MGHELWHETVIRAAPEAVWEALVDVASWRAWNPTFLDPEGPLVPGTTVPMRLRMGPFRMPMQQDIRVVDPPRILAWRSTNLRRGVMDVDRMFAVEAGTGGDTILTQSETASGWAVPFGYPLLRRSILSGFAALGDGLRRHLEEGEGHMASGKRIGQPKWRKQINQHEAFDHDSIDSLFYDWDRIADPGGPPRTPLKFYVPRTTEDVVAAVKECARLGQVLIVRSKGHSSNDLVTPAGGAVLLTEKLYGILDVDEQQMTATVYAGTPSADVDEELAQRGLGLPVIGDHAHITVGGFVAVGGITPSSFRYGLFVDTVQRLEYVDWDGEVHVVDRDNGTDQLNRLFTSLGRHGVITKVTVDIIRVEKFTTYWETDDVRFDDREEFIRTSAGILADPPEDARFIRGLWADVPRGSGKSRQMGAFSVFRDADPAVARRAIEKVAYGGLHRLGWMAGKLPDKIDEVVKTAGMVGVIYGPKYATVKNAELFTEKILDATVGDPQRFLVAIAPMRSYEDLVHRMWQILGDYRETHRCFTFITLYVKSIRSAYLSQGDPENERWVEVLFYVGVDPDIMTDTLLDRIAGAIDQACVETGSYRYMHTRTGRDPELLASIDPNAPYNDGRSIHPLDRRSQGAADA